MTTTPRHPLNKRIPDRRRPTLEQQLQTGAQLEQIAVTAPKVARAISDALESVAAAFARMWSTPPSNRRDDYTLTR